MRKRAVVESQRRPTSVDVAPSVSVVHGRPLPGNEPAFGLVEKGVNFRLVVALLQTGGRELLAPDLRGCQRWVPYPGECVADGLKERINLLWANSPAAGG